MSGPDFLAQQGYIPIYDEDRNRSFPGNPRSATPKRLANAISEEFVATCVLRVSFPSL